VIFTFGFHLNFTFSRPIVRANLECMPLALAAVASVVIMNTVHLHAFFQGRLRAAGERVAGAIVSRVDARDALVIPAASVDAAAAVAVGGAASRVAQAAPAVEHAGAARESDVGIGRHRRAAAVVSVIYALEGNGVAVEAERCQLVAESFLTGHLQCFVLKISKH